MTVYSKLSILINGIQTNVDFSQADTTLSVRTLRITDGMSSHDINSALLSVLLNGSDASQYHHHDSLYYRKAEVTAAIRAESDAARLAEGGFNTRLNTVEGIGAGSIAKALQDAKDFANSAVLVETTAARLAENALGERLNTVQGTGLGSIAKALQDAKDHADQAITNLIDGAEGAFDTLKEIAEQLRDDETSLGGLLAAVADIRAIYVHLDNAAMGGVSSGNVLRVNASNSIDVASNAAASSATGAFGVAAQASTYGQSTKIQVAGRAQVSTMEMFTPGSRVYLATDGQATQTPPESAGSAVVLLGIACSSNEVILNVQLVSVNGASSGGGGGGGAPSFSFGPVTATYNAGNANYDVSYPGSNLDQMGAVQLWELGGSSPVVGLMAWAFNLSGIVQGGAVNTSSTYVLKCTNDQQTTIVATSAPFQFPSA